MKPLETSMKALRPTRASNYEQVQKKRLRQAARMYETHFLNAMVKQMRKTVPDSGLVKKSFAEGYFRNQLDKKYVDAWAKKGGIGLTDMIYDQLVDKVFPKQSNMIRPQGPISVMKQNKHSPIPEEKKESGFKVIKGNPSEQGANFYFKRDGSVDDVELFAPWKGEVISKLNIGSNSLLKLQHENDLQSIISFNGEDEKIAIGDKINDGQLIGTLDKGSQGFLWSVRRKS